MPRRRPLADAPEQIIHSSRLNMAAPNIYIWLAHDTVTVTDGFAQQLPTTSLRPLIHLFWTVAWHISAPLRCSGSTPIRSQHLPRSIRFFAMAELRGPTLLMSQAREREGQDLGAGGFRPGKSREGTCLARSAARNCLFVHSNLLENCWRKNLFEVCLPSLHGSGQ